MLTFVDRAPEALTFFDGCGVRFLFIKDHGDHYFDGAPVSVGFGRILEVELTYASLAEKRKWGGVNDPRGWDNALLEQRWHDRMVGRGVGVVTHFLNQTLKRGVTICPASAADRLVFDGKRVTGVVTQGGTTVLARKGVVIASGAYESNPEMVATMRACLTFSRCIRRPSLGTASPWR